jgi:hypothetical protein
VTPDKSHKGRLAWVDALQILQAARMVRSVRSPDGLLRALAGGAAVLEARPFGSAFETRGWRLTPHLAKTHTAHISHTAHRSHMHLAALTNGDTIRIMGGPVGSLTARGPRRRSFRRQIRGGTAATRSGSSRFGFPTALTVLQRGRWRTCRLQLGESLTEWLSQEQEPNAARVGVCARPGVPTKTRPLVG